jgi:CRISPR-associated exonuclease Cas4
MSEPDELISISALQHYSYCPRQCALIHQEQTFTENVFTVRGRFAHERVDEPETRTESDREIQTSVPLVSERSGLIGKSDVVEILSDGSLRPVEYKHGPRRHREHDDIQVAAQAICLEEMTGKQVAEGVIYHHTSRRRRIVPITPELRTKVEEITKSVRALLQSGEMPLPVDNPALCRGCSLKEACQPELVKSGRQIRQLAETLFEPDDLGLSE